MSQANSLRKPKVEKRQRNILKAFRINEEELAGFEAMCKEENLSGGDLFRVKCCKAPALKKKKMSRDREVLLAKNLGRLARYGNNLNQMAKALNIAMYKPDAAASLHVLVRYQETIKEIQQTVTLSRDLLMKALDDE